MVSLRVDDEPSRINRRAFTRPDAVALYGNDHGLTATEQAALDLVRRARVADGEGDDLGRVLDVGVGVGRTTPGVAAMAQSYLGIDYVPAMVAAAASRYPDRSFAVGDVRQMPDLADEGFDLVLFSFNGLDALGHAGRLRALAEIRRVLASQGHLVFSTHNRLTPLDPPWRRRDLSWKGRAFATSLAEAASGLFNHLRLRRRQHAEETYALINDRAHNHAMLVYYITPQHQLAQLAAAGYVAAAIVGLDGRRIEAEDLPRDAWLHYICRRA